LPENGTPIFLRTKTGEHKVRPYLLIVDGEFGTRKFLDFFSIR
jgi:hypothetical protein